MSQIAEEEESRNISFINEEQQKQKEKIKINTENKFQNLKPSTNYENIFSENKIKNEEIEEQYEQDFDEDLLSGDLKTNKLLSNDFEAIKNVSYGNKLQNKNNISKSTSFNMDKLIQSNYSNYGFNEEIQESYEMSQNKDFGRKKENSQIKKKDETEIIEEVIYIVS